MMSATIYRKRERFMTIREKQLLKRDRPVHNIALLKPHYTTQQSTHILVLHKVSMHKEIDPHIISEQDGWMDEWINQHRIELKKNRIESNQIIIAEHSKCAAEIRWIQFIP